MQEEQTNNKSLIEEKLANVRKKMPKLKKDTKGYNYKYSDLNQLLEVLNPLLEKEGLLLKQPIITNGNVNILSTEISLVNNADAVVTSQMALPTFEDMQAIGSSVTYARRYTLQSLIGAASQDDDGDATLRTPRTSNRKPSSKSKF